MGSLKGNPYFEAAKVALEFMGFPHKMDRYSAVRAAVRLYERDGLSLSFRRVYALTFRPGVLSSGGDSIGKSSGGGQNSQNGKTSEIVLSFREDGLVEISQGNLVVVLLEEEARDQYPFLFEVDD